MNKKFINIVLSAILSLMMILTSATTFAEGLEISDVLVNTDNESNVVEDELVDNLEGHFSPVNPEFNRVRSSRGDEKFYGLRVDPLKINTNYDLFKQDSSKPWLSRQAAPQKYDLREHNRVTPVKNQGPNGSCWAFATYGSAESVLMPQEYNDFSEKNLRNTHGYDWGPDQGGTWQVASAYLTRGSGPIAERDEPYSPYDFNSPRGLTRVKDVDEIINVPDARNGFDVDLIKEAIMEHGAAYTTINGDESYLNVRTMGSYNPGYFGYANHAVTIVGWDDTFSRYNFGITPPGDGAWIIKNSWGQNWKYMGGYYYVSYHDAFCGKNNAIFKLKNKTPGEEIWYYDYLGMTSTFGNGETAYFSNVFGPTNGNKDVYEVGFYVPSNGARYEVYMTRGNGQVSFNDRVKVAEGSVRYGGYVSVPIDKFTVGSGQYFAPIVKMTTPGYYYPIPIEANIPYYSSRARANRGESYFSYNGQNWMDLTSQRYNANVALKAKTVPAGNYPGPDVNDKKISSIKFTEDPLNIEVGESKELNPQILPTDAANKKLNYSVNPSYVASVQNGVIKGLREGTATVTATATDGSYKRASFRVNVKKEVVDIPVRRINLNKEDLNLTVGGSDTILANIEPSDATNKNIYWSTSNARVATVSNGVVRANGVGECTITAKTQNGVSATAHVVVEEQGKQITYISLTPNNKSIAVGESYSLSATIMPRDAKNQTLSFVSENPRVATVSSNGVVKGISAGKTKITAKAQDGSNISQVAYVTVTNNNNDKQNGFKLNTTVESEVLGRGQSQTITVNAKDKYNRNLKYVLLTFEIVNPNGGTVRRQVYTDYYGNGRCVVNASELGIAGDYNVKITASGGSYTTTTDSVSFKVNDGRPTFDVTVTPQVKEIMNNGKIAINIKTSANGVALRYTDVTIEITTPEGKVNRNNGRTNYYGTTVYNYSPDNGPAGVYKVKVTASNSSYQNAIGTATFKVTKYKNPRYLNVDIKADKEKYELGDRANISISVKDQNNGVLRWAPVQIEVTGPNNFDYKLTKYTDWYGNTSIYVEPTAQMGEGIYTVNVTAKKLGHDDGIGEYKLAFGNVTPDKPDEPDVPDPVKPDEPDEPDPVKPEEKIYKMIETDEGQKMIEENKGNDNFVLLDVRTKAEYNESHIEGCIHHDYYSKDHKDFLKTLDRNKTYLLYCRTQVRSGGTAEMMKELGFTKIYWMNGGMTKWLRENRPSVFPEYEKALDINAGTEKTSYKAGGDVKVTGMVTDLEGNGIRKADISLTLKDENGRSLESKKISTGNSGELEAAFKAPNEAGRYTITLDATYKNFEKITGLAMFEVSDEEKEFKSYDEREREGQFKHLDKNSFEFESLKKYYGKNILQYFVKDAKLGNHQIKDLIDKNKKTVIVFGYPGCGACVDMWKAMAPLPHEKYNFIEVVTSVEEDVTSTVNFVDNVLKDLNIEHFKSHIYYDADQKIWASRLGFLTTPNTVVLDENGRLVNIAGALDKDGLYNLINKTLGINVEGDDVVDEKYNSNLTLELDNTEITSGDKVTMKAVLKDSNGQVLRGKKIRYTLKFPENKFPQGTYDRQTGYAGETNLYFTSDASSPEGTYEVTVEVVDGDLKAEKVTKTFELVNNKKSNYDLELSFGGETFKQGDVIRMNLTVKNQYGQAVSREPVKFTFSYPDGTSYNYDRQTDYYGRAMLTFTTSAGVPDGKYTLKAELKNDPTAVVEKSFTVGSNDDGHDDNDRPDGNNTLSYNDRWRNGEFNHLNDGDLGPKLRRVYGTNVKNYTLTNMSGVNVSIASLMDGKRPTVIAMGYPTCGGCQASWRSLVNIDKSSFNMVEAMTMGDNRSIPNILSRLGLQQMQPYFHYNARPLFNLINSNYVPCLMYLDKDGNITNISYFESNAEVLSIVRTIGNTISK